MIKKIIIYYLAFCVAIAPSFVFANTAGGTWQQVGSWQQGATTVWEAMKKEGDKLYNGYAKVKPTVKQVSSAILKGGKNATIAYALSVIVGEMVDYVLDPANNSVRIIGGDTQIYEIITYNGEGKVGTVSQLEHIACSGNGYGRGNRAEDHFIFSGTTLSIRCNNGYAWLEKKQEIPIDKVAAQVIDNADAEHAGSKRFVADVANSNTTEKDKTAQFEATKTDAQDYVSPKDDTKAPAVPGAGADTANPARNDTATQNPPDTANPDKPFELPTFCGWASTVCEFVEWAKSEPQTKDEPTKIETTDIDIGDWQSKANRDYIRGSSACPADVSIPINYMSIHSEIKLSYQPFCRFASMIKPAVIMGAWISGLMIITGGRTKE